MTCKDCMHFLVCEKAYHLHNDADVSKRCKFAKNKSDYVEVVRCPECIYCENMKCTELRDNSGHPLDVAIFDYCSQGVRK